MGEEHLDLFPELHCNLIFFGLSQISSDLARVLVLLAGDLARISVGAAFWLGRADLADIFQGAVSGCAPAGRASIWIRVIPAELFERMPLWADILIILSVPFEVCACPGAVGASRLVDYRDLRINFAIYEPTEHRAGTVCRDPYLSGNCRNN